jgi:parallel beta-helix repeat protein
MNVKGLGALGDGTTDDTAIFQAVIDSLPAAGGTIYVPVSAAPYMINVATPIALRSNNIFYIERGATLKAITNNADTYAIIHVNDADNVIVEGGGKIQGDMTTHLQTAAGVVATTLASPALTGGETAANIADATGWAASGNCVIVEDDGSYHLAVFSRSGTALTLQTAVPIGFAAAVGNAVYQASGEGGIGIRVENSTNVTIRDMEITECWGDGIYVTEFERSTNLGTKYVNILNCHCHHNRRQGLSIVGGRYISVIGGIYSYSQGAQPQHGIDIEPSSTYECDDITIMGVQAIYNQRDGIRVLGPNTARVTIADCRASENAQRGISIFYDGGHKIDGCTVYGNGTSGVAANDGIVIASDATNAANANEVLNCTILDNDGHGVEVTDGGAGCDRTVIRGNTLRQNGGGIQIGAPRTAVVGNQVYDSGNYGIQVLAVDEAEIISNIIVGADLVGIQLNDAHYCSLSCNDVRQGNRHGIQLAGASHNNVQGNTCVQNGLDANATYDNINLASNSDYNNVQGNLCRRDTGSGNQSRYGVNVQTTDCDANVVTNNDLYNGGATNNLRDNGTGTVTAAGNRV